MRGGSMSTTPIDNTENIIDSRDVIARIAQLEEERDCWQHDDDLPWNECCPDDAKELDALETLAEQCEGYGDWGHGEALIHEDHFVKYIEELIDDCYSLPKELTSGQWPYRHITIDYEAAAEEAKVDYTEVDFDGQTYFLRA